MTKHYYFFITSFTNLIKYILQNTWNSHEKKFLGRTAIGWLKLFAFYLCFYLCLAGIFISFFALFMSKLDIGRPRYANNYTVMSRASIDGKSIGLSPGMGFRPQKDAHTTLIRMRSNVKNLDHPYNFQQYIDILDEYFEPYIVEFLPMFGKDNNCTSKNNYGFDRAKPCVLVKLNRIFDWIPEPYEPSDRLPEELLPYEKTVREYPENIFVLCEGENPVDKDHIGSITYYSRAPEGPGASNMGFLPFEFYPYFREDDYTTPLVFAHFETISTNVLVNVICKAYAKNIYRDNLNRNGAVHFELFIE